MLVDLEIDRCSAWTGDNPWYLLSYDRVMYYAKQAPVLGLRKLQSEWISSALTLPLAPVNFDELSALVGKSLVSVFGGAFYDSRMLAIGLKHFLGVKWVGVGWLKVAGYSCGLQMPGQVLIVGTEKERLILQCLIHEPRFDFDEWRKTETAN